MIRIHEPKDNGFRWWAIGRNCLGICFARFAVDCLLVPCGGIRNKFPKHVVSKVNSESKRRQEMNCWVPVIFSREKLQFFPIKLFIEGIFPFFGDIFCGKFWEQILLIKSTIFFGWYPQLIEDDGIWNAMKNCQRNSPYHPQRDFRLHPRPHPPWVPSEFIPENQGLVQTKLPGQFWREMVSFRECIFWGEP